MSWFGLNSSISDKQKPPSTSSIIKELNDIKKRVEVTRQLSVKYNERLNAMNNLNKVLATGYTSNIEVIVDISRLLIEYRDTLNVVLQVINEFDDVFSSGQIKASDIEKIHSDTQSKLQQVRNFFANDVSKVINILNSADPQKRETFVRKLKSTEDNFYRTLEESEKMIQKNSSIRIRGGATNSKPATSKKRGATSSKTKKSKQSA